MSQPQKVQSEGVESSVWELVHTVLTNPEQLREDLERMIEQERQGPRGLPDSEAKAWLQKVSEVNQVRGNYQEMAARGLITFDELEEKLEQL